MHIAKSLVIDTDLFFENSMIYKIHVYFKTLSLVQLMHVNLNVSLKSIKQNQYMKEIIIKTFNRKQTTQNYSK